MGCYLRRPLPRSLGSVDPGGVTLGPVAGGLRGCEGPGHLAAPPRPRRAQRAPQLRPAAGAPGRGERRGVAEPRARPPTVPGLQAHRRHRGPAGEGGGPGAPRGRGAGGPDARRPDADAVQPDGVEALPEGGAAEGVAQRPRAGEGATAGVRAVRHPAEAARGALQGQGGGPPSPGEGPAPARGDRVRRRAAAALRRRAREPERLAGGAPGRFRPIPHRRVRDRESQRHAGHLPRHAVRGGSGAYPRRVMRPDQPGQGRAGATEPEGLPPVRERDGLGRGGPARGARLRDCSRP